MIDDPTVWPFNLINESIVHISERLIKALDEEIVVVQHMSAVCLGVFGEIRPSLLYISLIPLHDGLTIHSRVDTLDMVHIGEGWLLLKHVGVGVSGNSLTGNDDKSWSVDKDQRYKPVNRVSQTSTQR